MMQMLNKYSGLFTVIITVITIFATERVNSGLQEQKISDLSKAVTQCQVDLHEHILQQNGKEKITDDLLKRIEITLTRVETELEFVSQKRNRK